MINPPPLQWVEKHDRAPFPHIGLGYLAASLRRESIECAVIDAKLERLSINKVIGRVVRYAPSLVGITAMTHEIARAEITAVKIRDALPSSLIAIGGVHAIALPKETLREFRCFDFLFAGEAEYSLPALVKEIESGSRDFSKIKAFAYREGNRIVLNPRRSFCKNLDKLPFPAWDMFPPAKIYPLMTSRGCPYKCVFCARPYGDTIRARSPENIVDEIGLLVTKYKPRMMYIFDETFGYDQQRLERLMDLIMERGYHKALKWDAGCNLEIITKRMLSRMKAAGCVCVMFGVESGNEEIIKRMGKKIDLRKALEVAQWIRELGLDAESFFILGHPNESMKTAIDTIRFAAKLNTPGVSFGVMAPYPGTAVYEMAKRNQCGYRFLSRDWRDFNKQLGKALELEGLPRYQLESLQMLGYIWFYLSKFRLWDFLKFSWHLRREALAFVKNFVAGLLARRGNA